MNVNPQTVRHLIDTALAEDLGSGDMTSEAVVPENARFAGQLTARQDLIVAGIGVAHEMFRTLDGRCTFKTLVNDGEPAAAGRALATIEGRARPMLAAERTALNLLQHLSGIATETRAYAERIAGTGAVLLDTRKTVPGLRELAKFAARMGGAQNHRLRLDNGVLIKDNHIAVAGSVAEAVDRAQKAGLADIEVECDTLDQVGEALSAGADRLLLDNMDLKTLRRAVELVSGKAKTEASGGVTLEDVRAIAETGVDFISVGRITQSAPAADIGLDWRQAD